MTRPPWIRALGALATFGVLASAAWLSGDRAAAATVTTVSNSSYILIPGRGNAIGTSINVPPGLGSLQELTVTVHNLSHPEAYKIYDMYMIGPRGQTVHLMQQVGGNALISNLTLSFNDAGIEFGSNPVTAATYRPTEGSLTMFNGADPGGSWYLTVNVAIATSDGSISGGWSLSLTTDSFPQTFTFTNEPVTASATLVHLAHLTELRSAVNTLRQRHGLAAFSFSDPTAITIRAVHITELRSALGAVFTVMGRAGPTYTDTTITAQTTPIKAAHVNELRSAIREADAMPLTVIKAGAGTGTVKSTSPGIACGNDCADAYAPGTLVTLTATPAANSVFAGWSGACSGTSSCQLTMNAALSATATFNIAPITLTVVKSGAGTGGVVSNPAGLDCGSTCVQAFTAGTAVSLFANPAAGSSFSGWSGPCSGTGTCQITITSSTQVTAAFSASAAQTYDAQPVDAHLGAWGGCNGAVFGKQFSVTAPAGTSWQVTWTGSDLPPSSHAGGLNKTSGTGNDTVIFTITVAAGSPGSGRTCADAFEYYYTDYFTFRFYNSAGAQIATRFTQIRWTYLAVF